MSKNPRLKKLKQFFNFSKPSRAKVPSEDDTEVHIRNARKLANFMEQHSIRHDQASWINGNTEYPCKTFACALGTAAIFGVIPGLQYTLSSYDANRIINVADEYGAEKAKKINPEFEPFFDGASNPNWEEAGYRFFGADITDEVFLNTRLNKQQVINRLREIASRMERDLKVETAYGL